MKVSHVILMLFSLPMLVFGWVLAAMGIYYLGASFFNYQTSEEIPSLAAIWSFLFSFGIIAIAGFLAVKAKFASNTSVRQIYKYSIILSAALFLGYQVIGFLALGIISIFDDVM